MSQGHSHEHFDKFEYICIIVGTAVFTILDASFILQTPHQGNADIAHEIVQGFLLSTIASSMVAMILRGFRTREEILDAIESHKSLSRFKRVSLMIRKITSDCISICNKRWPTHARELLNDRLEQLLGFVQDFNNGTIKLGLGEATLLSPRFFAEANGKIIVTSYGQWDYWQKEPGKRQLDECQKAIASKRLEITRVFIIPSSESLKPSDLNQIGRILVEHAKTGVLVRVGLQEDLPDGHCRDIGVFFKDKEGKKINFVSEWIIKKGQENEEAILYYQGHQLGVCVNVANLLTQHSTTAINDLSDWNKLVLARYNVNLPTTNPDLPAQTSTVQ